MTEKILTVTELRQSQCLRPDKDESPLSQDTIVRYVEILYPHWQCSSAYTAISRDFLFRNFYETMAFVNALAWIANCQDHHPDLEVGYNHCKVVFTTHSIGGLSLNDFICAAKIDALTLEKQDSV